MKANELQIGDYVDYRGQIIKVTSLYDKGGSNEVGWGKNEDTWVNAVNVEPIPLTPEILEKNGFKLNPQGSYSIGRNISIDMLDGRYNANMNTNSSKASSFLYQVGKYVHELQHALRLCRINKEIVL